MILYQSGMLHYKTNGMSPSFLKHQYTSHVDRKAQVARALNDFCLCVEIPINAKRNNQRYCEIASQERKRIAGFKKVNEFKDGLKILIYMIQKFFRIK